MKSIRFNSTAVGEKTLKIVLFIVYLQVAETVIIEAWYTQLFRMMYAFFMMMKCTHHMTKISSVSLFHDNHEKYILNHGTTLGGLIMLHIETGEELSTFENFASDFIKLLSEKQYEQALQLIGTGDHAILESEPSLTAYLEMMFEDLPIDHPVPYSDTISMFELYHHLDGNGYSMDCEVFSEGKQTDMTLQFEFLHKKNRTEYEVILAPIHVMS